MSRKSAQINMPLEKRYNFQFDDKVTVEELFDLLDRMTKSEEDRFPAKNVFHVALRNDVKEQESLNNTVAITARRADGILVGYLRILTDRAYMYYILDVMVEPDSRHRGIGARLVDIAVNECKARGFIKIFLTAIPGSEDFYKKFGFRESMSPVLAIRGEDHV